MPRPYSTHSHADEDACHQENPFMGSRGAPLRMDAADLEPFTMVDEVEFSKRFRDIATLVDDESDDAILLRPSVGRENGASHHSVSLEYPDGNHGFNCRLMAPIQTLLDPNGANLISPAASRPASHHSSPRRPTACKSFLDDDWLLDRVEHDSNMAMVAAGLVRPRSAVHFDNRSRTPLPDHARHYASLNVSKETSPIRPDSQQHHLKPKAPSHPTNSGPPPRDYICRLCNVSGHWLKDCELFEPRHGTSMGKLPASQKDFRSLPITGSSAASGNPIGPKTGSGIPPPRNYICRLCGVSGHWIEQCSQFQPKLESSKAAGPAGMLKEKTSCFKSIPPPSGYLCNLCHQPGHWLQQCARFEPIPSGRRR